MIRWEAYMGVNAKRSNAAPQPPDRTVGQPMGASKGNRKGQGKHNGKGKENTPINADPPVVPTDAPAV